MTNIYHYFSLWNPLFLQKYKNYIALTILLLIWVASPMFGILCLSIYFVVFRVSQTGKFLLWLYPITFALLNYTQVAVYGSDLYSYLSEYEELANKNFLDLFQFRSYDPGFYCVSWVLAKVIGLRGDFFSAFWVFFTYSFFTLSLINFAKYNKDDLNPYKYIAVIVLCVFFFGMTFYMSSQLIRQFAAASLLMYALSKAFFCERHAYTYFLIATLMHISALIFLPAIVFAYKKKFSENMLWFSIGLVFVIAFLVGNYNVIELTFHSYFINLKLIKIIFYKLAFYLDFHSSAETRINVYHRLMYFFAVWLILLSKYFIGVPKKIINRKVIFTLAYMIGLLLLFRNADVLFLRYYFFSSFLIAFGIIALLFDGLIIEKSRYKFILIFIILLANFQFVRSLEQLEKNGVNYVKNSTDIYIVPFWAYLKL